MYYNRIRPSLYLPDVYAEIFAIACNMVTKPMKHTDMPRTTTGVIFGLCRSWRKATFELAKQR